MNVEEMNWVDATSYSQNEKHRTPRVWECYPSKNIKLCVHKYIGCGDAWFATASYLSPRHHIIHRYFNQIDLYTENIDEAKLNAIKKLNESMLRRENELLQEQCEIKSVLTKLINM